MKVSDIINCKKHTHIIVPFLKGKTSYTEKLRQIQKPHNPDLNEKNIKE